MPSRKVQKVKEISDVMHEYAGRILKDRREQQRELSVSDDSGKRERPRDVISMLRKSTTLHLDAER
jgi:hypothetical protein